MEYIAREGTPRAQIQATLNMLPFKIDRAERVYALQLEGSTEPEDLLMAAARRDQEYELLAAQQEEELLAQV